MSLVDAWGRSHTYLRISVTETCNLRCVYCCGPLRAGQTTACDDLLTFDEIVRVAHLLASMGVRKIRLTGGEPTLRDGIEHLAARLASVPGVGVLGMTTNGVRLSDLARRLRAAGLQTLNISLDTLRRERFPAIAGRQAFDDVIAGMEAALSAGFPKVKLNVVVMAGVNDDELIDFVELARHQPISVRFIEYMPFAGIPWHSSTLVTYHEMRKAIEAHYHLTPASPGARGDGIAKEFCIEGFRGTVGFITPLSAEFCADCNRLRLTATGSLRPCLFSSIETDLRPALRGPRPEEHVSAAIRRALSLKPRRHPALRRMRRPGNRPMIAIGG